MAHRRIRKLGLAALVAGTSVAIVPDVASAYSLYGNNCRYDPKNDDDGLGIGFNSTNFNQARRDATEDGAARWNAKVTPQFTIVSYGSSTRDLRVDFSRLGAGGPVAQTTVWCGTSYYTQDPRFEWNLDFTHPSPTFRRNSITAIHEIGHSYGLDHNFTSGCDTKTAGLMFTPSSSKYDECGWIDPTTDDVNGQIDAHNG